MKIIAFETCFKGASVSLLINGDIYTLEEKRESRQSETLSEMTKYLLSKNKIELQEFDFAISNKGPGSFTGVRIGLSFLEGLCFESKVRKLFLSSFVTSLGSFPEIKLKKNLLVVIQAIKETFYIQRFSPEFKEIGDAEYLNLVQVRNLIDSEEVELFGKFEGYDLGKTTISNSASINSENVLRSFLRFKYLANPSNAPFYLRSAVNLNNSYPL